MTDDSPARAIRGLTASIWALAIVLVVSTLAQLVSAVFLSPEFWTGATTASGAGQSTESSLDGSTFKDKYEEFHDWPVERRVASASAIVMTKHRIEGEDLISTVSEVLKLEPGTALYYDVGAEYKRRKTAKRTSYGDGEVVFFTGSPAQMRYSVTCSAGRCEGLGGIPLDTLRKLIIDSVGRTAVPES